MAIRFLAGMTSLRAVIAFSAAYLVTAAAWIFISGNYEFLAYIVIVLILAGVILLIHRRIALPASLIWCLSAWGALHMAGGLIPLPDDWPVGGGIPVLYNWHIAGPYFKYDQVVHAFGFGVTTWVCWRGLTAYAPQLASGPRVGALTLCAAAGIGFGALNEVVEFTITLIVPENNVGGYLNTALDLVYNTFGSVIAAVAIGVRARRS